MKTSGIGKFLGVSMGTSKTSGKAYFHISIFDDDGRTLRMRCDEDVYNAGMVIPFGKDVMLDVNIGEYQGQSITTVTKITE